MNDRQSYELSKLMDEGILDMESIAHDFRVSTRQIRYDIEGLNQMVSSVLNVPNVISVKSGIASIETPSSGWSLFRMLGRDSDFSVSTTPRGRVLSIVFDLCCASAPITASDFATKYAVSRNTIIRDFDRIRVYCAEHGVEVISLRGIGFKISGAEKDIRRCLSSVVKDIHQEIPFSRNNLANYLPWFDQNKLTGVSHIIDEIETTFSFWLDDISYEALIVHIVLSIERYGGHSTAGDPSIRKCDIRLTAKQLELANFIVRRVNDKFGITLPEDELYYIGMHVGAKISTTLVEEDTPNLDISHACEYLINAVGNMLGYDLKHDEQLAASLNQHLHKCIYQHLVGLNFENPLREELMHSYTELFSVIKKAVATSGMDLLMELSDDEVAYITLHFAVARNRLDNVHQICLRHPRVIVACTTGIGTAELLSERLLQQFELDIVAKIPTHRLRSTLEELTDIDLCISTVPLSIDGPYVQVSPLLLSSDAEAVSAALRDCGFKVRELGNRGTAVSGVALEVKRALAANQTPEQEGRLLDELRNICCPSDKNVSAPPIKLSMLLDPAHIALDVPASNWQEAVWAAGSLLIEADEVTEEYVALSVSHISSTGPYVVITKGFALPHASERDGVIRTSMALVRLAKPVNFGNKINDPVLVVCMFAALTAQEVIPAISTLGSMLTEEDFVHVVAEAKYPDEITEAIRRFEKDEGSKCQREGG